LAFAGVFGESGGQVAEEVAAAASSHASGDSEPFEEAAEFHGDQVAAFPVLEEAVEDQDHFVEEVEVAVKEGDDLCEFDFPTNRGAGDLEPGALEPLHAVNHVGAESQFVGAGKAESEGAGVVLAVHKVLDQTHVVDHFDVQDFEEVLVRFNGILAVVEVEGSGAAFGADDHVFVGGPVAEHAEESAGVFLDEVVHVVPLFLDLGE